MGLNFKQETAPKYGVATPWSPLVTRVLCKNPSPFTYTGTGTFIIGNTDVAIIDPGPDNEDHLKALLKAIGDRPVRGILITHNHTDHSPLAVKLAEATSAPIIGPKLPDAFIEAGEGAVKMDAGLDHTYAPDQIITDGQAISGEGWTLKAVHTPGHVSHHMSYHLIEEKSLFCGDHIMGWATSVIIPPEGNLRAYLKSLSDLLGQGYERFYPTHGLAIDNPDKFMRATIVHRHMREGQILSCIKDGRSTVADMVGHMYKNVDVRLHGAAALSVMAHLIALLEEGKITADQKDLKSAVFHLK